MRATGFFKAILPELRAWRHDFHQHPEIAFEEVRTSNIIFERLQSFGLKPVANVGRTGIVATIEGTAGPSKKKVGLRADIDALPMTEEGHVPYRSVIPGRFHGCGHDGHTTMLLVRSSHPQNHTDTDENTITGSRCVHGQESPPVFGYCAVHFPACGGGLGRCQGHDRRGPLRTLPMR
jgi:metal-dependent amidase/aminoacylase/carboxypeptidase family protein